MTRKNRHLATSARRALGGLGAAVAFVAVLSSIGGCQGRGAAATNLSRVLRDSLLAGNEALYDSATAELAWNRLTCLEYRGLRMLGDDELRRLALEVDRTVQAKHSRAEYLAGERGIAYSHEAPTETFCAQIDSLWYATIVKKRIKRP